MQSRLGIGEVLDKMAHNAQVLGPLAKLASLCVSEVIRAATQEEANDQTEESEHRREDLDDENLDEPGPCQRAAPISSAQR